MPSLGKDHIHSYRFYKKTRNGNELYKCNDPDCYHHDDKKKIEGKKSMCPDCGSPFILDKENLKRKTPKCLACMDTVKGRARKAISEEIVGLFSK